MGSTAVSKSSKSKVSRSYTPVSFYMDSAVNHPGPIRKGYRLGCGSSESMIAESIGKNSIPLSMYRTTLVYHPAESVMDIYLTNQAKVRHQLSFYMDPTLSFPARKINYIPAVGHNSSRSKSAPNVTFCFQSSPSTPQFIFGSFGSHSSQSKSVAKVSKNSIPLSTESKVSRKYIPENTVALSILSKLPVQSLKRFGCVCKSWSTLFENSDFMTMYTNHFISRHASQDDYLTFILANHLLGYRHYHSEFHLLERRLKFNLPSPLQRSAYYTCILGSTTVNGIFCLGQNTPYMDSQSLYVLWNPLTQEIMVIPSSPAQLTPKHSSGATVYRRHVFHGFGYDQFRHDFKIIQYVSFISDNCPGLTTSFVEIYSLKNNSWRMIDMDNDLSHWTYIHSKSFNGLEVYLDGACHWLVSDGINHRYSMTLLSFDLTMEVFTTTPIGEEPHNPYSGLGRLTVLNGSIALISNYHDDLVFQISILGKLGVSESWIKLYTYGPLPSIQWPPIGFGKVGPIFFKKKDYEVAYVDLSTQRIEEVGITGGKTNYNIGGLYKESLLSLKDRVTRIV